MVERIDKQRERQIVLLLKVEDVRQRTDSTV